MTVADGFTLLEGPRWHDGALWVSDFFSESVLRIVRPERPGGEVTTVCTISGRPSGLGFAPSGDLLVVSMLEGSLYRVRRGAAVRVADFGELICGPANDMHVDATGRAYIGSFGVTGPDGDQLTGVPLVRVDPDGSITAAAEGLIFPNGIAPSPDGRHLYVAETYAARVIRFAVDGEGALSERHVFLDLSGGRHVSGIEEGNRELPVLPDGLVVDREGGVWVADAKGSGVTRYDATGSPTDVVESGDVSVYAAALGGADGRSLFLCCAPAVGTFDPSTEHASRLMVARVQVPGASWPA